MITPTLEEKVKMYERFLHDINMARVCGNNDAMNQLINNADTWSYMHRVGNGGLTEEEQQDVIDNAFHNLCKVDWKRATLKWEKEREDRLLDPNYENPFLKKYKEIVENKLDKS